MRWNNQTVDYSAKPIQTGPHARHTHALYYQVVPQEKRNNHQCKQNANIQPSITTQLPLFCFVPRQLLFAVSRRRFWTSLTRRKRCRLLCRWRWRRFLWIIISTGSGTWCQHSKKLTQSAKYIDTYWYHFYSKSATCIRGVVCFTAPRSNDG